MFSSVTRRLSSRALDRLDLLVELSTLGEYGLDREGIFALERTAASAGSLAGPPASVRPPATAVAPRQPRARDECPHRLRIIRFCRDGAARR